MQKLLIVTCWAIAVLFFVVWASRLAMDLVLNYGYMYIMMWSADKVTAATVIFYQIKFCAHQEVNCDIFNGIIYLDQSLESLYVKVPHTRNIIECVVHLSLIHI